MSSQVDIIEFCGHPDCEHLITIQENAGMVGGLRGFLESPITNQVTLVLLLDQGFRKSGIYLSFCRLLGDS